MNLRKRISLTMPVPVYQILHHIVSIGTLTVWTKEDGAKAQNAMDLAGIAARRRTDMKRLTWRVNGEARIMLNGIEICGMVADRLAAYEDTGLEPEEIIELKGRMEGLEK